MKKTVFQFALALGALGSVACASALAAGPLGSNDGFSITANVESAGGTSTATDGTSDSGQTTGLGLQARYDWSITPDFTLGVGAGFSGGNHQAGTYMSGAGVTTNNRYSLDFVPAYSLGNDTQVFGKVSALAANVASDDGSGNAFTQGVGYGIGLRQMLDRNMFWQAGYDLNRYNDVAFSTGTTTGVQEHVFSLGLGYKF